MLSLTQILYSQIFSSPLLLCHIGHIFISMSPNDKDLVWLHGEVKTPPFFTEARLEVDYLLKQLQQGIRLSMPQCRRCHELRINDENGTWRMVYRMDDDAIVQLAVFDKKTNTTPKHIIDTCKDRIRRYDNESC